MQAALRPLRLDGKQHQSRCCAYHSSSLSLVAFCRFPPTHIKIQFYLFSCYRYPYWILVQDYRHGSLFLKRAVGLLAVSTFFLLRICYAQPGLLYTAYVLLRYEQGIVHGVAIMMFVVGFIYLNLLNFTKLVRGI